MACNCRGRANVAQTNGRIRFSCLAACGRQPYALLVRNGRQVIIVPITIAQARALRRRGAQICVDPPVKSVRIVCCRKTGRCRCAFRCSRNESPTGEICT